MRDASTESLFFTLYTQPFMLHFAEQNRDRHAASPAADPLPFVKDALASIDRGGYTEAVARAAFLLERSGEPFPLAQLATERETAETYASICRTCRPTSGGASAASRKSSRPTRAQRPSRRCRRCWSGRRIASGC